MCDDESNTGIEGRIWPHNHHGAHCATQTRPRHRSHGRWHLAGGLGSASASGHSPDWSLSARIRL